ncbi:copper transporter [Ruania alkalisoli]|uniref:Copper transporter n=1 Tax=Ruania alkalisoli TaxID=2779775 RepID=A0A7M1T010_9MICO|nr:copper transporter [Ruania alkalisoli]QOR72223.1 copper transporter [Ruania alkalisoli]
MIDFRYHIVSLISVFLALAVGIVLGAGPLRDYIADELSGQVEQLRAEKDALREDLDVAEAALQGRSTFLTEAAPQLYDGVLEGRTVAIVTLPETDSAVAEAVEARLVQAGAAISGRVAVAPGWTDPAETAFRAGIAENLVAQLNPAPDASTPADHVLAQALGQSLTLRDPGAPQRRSAEADDILEILRTSELVTESSTVEGPAYATVVVGPNDHHDEPLTDAELTEAETTNEAYLVLAAGIAETGEGSVLAGVDGGAGTLLAALRSGSDTDDVAITSVDSVGTITGQVTVPLALAATIAGEGAQFGLEESADLVLPEPVTLDLPDPAAFAPGPVGADDQSTDDADDDQTDDTDDDQSADAEQSADADQADG